MSQHIQRHRFHVAEDTVRELQFMVNGRWHSLAEMVQDYGRWADVQRYCVEHSVAPEERVGQLIRAKFKRGWYLGRVSFFDPGDNLYQVIFEDKDADTYDADTIDRLAYSGTAAPAQRAAARTRQSRRPRTWNIERVLDERDGEYLVRWEGYGSEADTWVKAGDFVDGAKNPLIMSWHEAHDGRRARGARLYLLGYPSESDTLL